MKLLYEAAPAARLHIILIINIIESNNATRYTDIYLCYYREMP